MRTLCFCDETRAWDICTLCAAVARTRLPRRGIFSATWSNVLRVSVSFCICSWSGGAASAAAAAAAVRDNWLRQR